MMIRRESMGGPGVPGKELCRLLQLGAEVNAMRIFLCLIFLAVLLFSSLDAQAQAPASLSAWDVLVGENPSLIDQATEIERELLQLMTPDQVQSYLEGADPSAVVLMTGEPLDAFLTRKGISSFDLSWYSIGGGGAMTGGDFTLVGAMGQGDAGVMSGGSFTLTGGFLGSEPGPLVDPCTGSDAIFCDGFESGGTSAWSIP